MTGSNQVSLRTWGNSQGIRIPKEILQKLNLSSKEDVQFNLYVENQEIILKPIKKISVLQKFFDDFNEDYEIENSRYDWGEECTVGREVF